MEGVMGAVLDYQVIKSIGSSGQISLGKEFAGRKVVVENPEPGVWLIRTATIIPDNEKWIHTPSNKKDLAEALAWAQQVPAKASDISKLKMNRPNGKKHKT